jgi:hypothetical protein
MPEVYEQTLWIPQNFSLTNPDLHHRLLSQKKTVSSTQSSRGLFSCFERFALKILRKTRKDTVLHVYSLMPHYDTLVVDQLRDMPADQEHHVNGKANPAKQ